MRKYLTQGSVSANELENIITYMDNKEEVNQELEKYFNHIEEFYIYARAAEDPEDSENNASTDWHVEKYYDDIGYQAKDENSQLYSSNLIKALERLVREDSNSRNDFFKEFKSYQQKSNDAVNEKDKKEYIKKFLKVLALIRKYINLYCQAKRNITSRMNNAINSITKKQKDIYEYVAKSLPQTNSTRSYNTMQGDENNSNNSNSKY